MMTTAAAPDVDPVRAFTEALRPAARHHLQINYDTIPLIRAGSERHGPAELARIVGTGIGNALANPYELMLYRLRREAGRLDNDREDDD